MSSKMSNASAIACIVSSTLGSGITSMPAVFNMLGTVKGFLVMGFMGLITFHSIYCLSYVATITKEKPEEEPSYTGLAAKFSKNLERCVTLSLVVSVLSTTFAFSQKLSDIFIDILRTNSTLDTFFEENEGGVKYYMFKVAFLAIFCSVYYFLFLLDDLSSLAIFSQLSLFTAVLFSLVISYYGIRYPIEQAALTEEHLNFGGALGNAVFAIHCQFTFLNVFNSLKDNSLSNVRFVTIAASVLATALYSAVGFFGYRGLGSDICDQSVLSIFSKDATTVTNDPKLQVLLRVLASLEKRYGKFVGGTLPKILCFMFAPIFFVGIVASIFSITPVVQNMLSRDNKRPSRKTMAVLGCAFVLLSGLYKVKSIDGLLAIFGYLLTTPLSFLFPSLFVIYTSKKMNLMTISSIAMVVLSAALMVGLLIIELRTLASKQ